MNPDLNNGALQVVYVTAESRDEALRLAKALVSERLAACANVIDHMQSVYWWEGALQEDDEAILILKTRRALVEPLVQRIRNLHSYDCPCVAALPIEGGNPDYLSWIMNETSNGTVP